MMRFVLHLIIFVFCFLCVVTTLLLCAFTTAAAAAAVLARQSRTRCDPWPLCDPLDPSMTQRAPDVFTAFFNTSIVAHSSSSVTDVSTFGIFVNRTWSPHGADRFFNLVRLGFFNSARFFRVLPGFVVQFGISGDPRLSSVYCNDLTCNASNIGAVILPDPLLPNAPSNGQIGSVSYSLMNGGVNASTEIFINLGNNSRLDADGFVPFGILQNKFTALHTLSALYSGYGEVNESSLCPGGRSVHNVPCKGPHIMEMVLRGNSYLEKDFPLLDYTVTATVVSSHSDMVHQAFIHRIEASNNKTGNMLL